MRFTVVLTLLCATFASHVAAEQRLQPGTAASVSEATQFWLTWEAQNSRALFAKATKEILECSLAIDPENSRVAKLDGKGRFIGALTLPEHKHWKAFHITPQGIAELSLPVRLQWVHSSQGLPETIRIQSTDTVELPYDLVRFAMDFAPQTARPGGYGSVPTTETFQFPQTNSEANDNKKRKSMLLGVDINTLEYQATINVGRTTLTVAQR